MAVEQVAVEQVAVEQVDGQDEKQAKKQAALHRALLDFKEDDDHEDGSAQEAPQSPSFDDCMQNAQYRGMMADFAQREADKRNACNTKLCKRLNSLLLSATLPTPPPTPLLPFTTPTPSPIDDDEDMQGGVEEAWGKHMQLLERQQRTQEEEQLSDPPPTPRSAGRDLSQEEAWGILFPDPKKVP